jgi:hypothetical protein
MTNKTDRIFESIIQDQISDKLIEQTIREIGADITAPDIPDYDTAAAKLSKNPRKDTTYLGGQMKGKKGQILDMMKKKVDSFQMWLKVNYKYTGSAAWASDTPFIQTCRDVTKGRKTPEEAAEFIMKKYISNLNQDFSDMRKEGSAFG